MVRGAAMAAVGAALSGCGGAGQAQALNQWLTQEEQERLRGDEIDVLKTGEDSAGILRRRAREVPDRTELHPISRKMVEAMEREGGVGIAGPQVGLSLRVAMMRLGFRTQDPWDVFVINPLILSRSDELYPFYEGCLSVPDLGGLVRRNAQIEVEYTDLTWKKQRLELEGADAVLWQHELDHLDGVLYVDRVQGELVSKEEMKALREALEASRHI